MAQKFWNILMFIDYMYMPTSDVFLQKANIFFETFPPYFFSYLWFCASCFIVVK